MLLSNRINRPTDCRSPLCLLRCGQFRRSVLGPRTIRMPLSVSQPAQPNQRSQRAVRATLALKSLTSHQFNFLWLRDPTDAPCRDSLHFRPTRSIPAIHFAKPSHEASLLHCFSTRESIENHEIFNPDAQSRHRWEERVCISQSPVPGVPDSTFEVPMC
jgi:hypothetical protein